jgi:hypothetical protein
MINAITEILEAINFPEPFSLDESSKYSKIESFEGYKFLDPINTEYIHKYQYLSRQSEELWRSLDIFIALGKETEVISKINTYLKNNNLDELSTEISNSKESLLDRITDNNSNYKIYLVKVNGYLIIQITNFYYEVLI